MTAAVPAEPLLTPAETAARFGVDPKTVTRWAKAGKLASVRTPGNHRRYREAEVNALIAGETVPAPARELMLPGAPRRAVVSRGGRYADCRYLVTSPGHKAACGDGAT
jgi:excisionase family DNA binding protein